MGGIFSIDSKLMKVLNRFVDMVLLNVIFLVTCIPVVTIGASLTALYSVTMKWAKHEDGYIIRRYFQSWKNNFKQATAIWLLQLAMMFLLSVDTRLCSAYQGSLKLGLLLLIGIAALLVGISVLFVYPILAQFEAPVKNMLVNSICIPFSNMLTSLTVVAITVIPFIIILLSSQLFYIWCYFVVMGWFALIAYLNSVFLQKLFAPFMENSEREVD